MENVVALEIARRIHRNYQQVYYLRKDKDFEVDFVIVERSQVIELIQVTYDFSNPSDKLYEREIEGLTRGSEYTHCDNLTLIVMYGKTGIIEHNNKKINIISVVDWL